MWRYHPRVDLNLGYPWQLRDAVLWLLALLFLVFYYQNTACSLKSLFKEFCLRGIHSILKLLYDGSWIFGAEDGCSGNNDITAWDNVLVIHPRDALKEHFYRLLHRHQWFWDQHLHQLRCLYLGIEHVALPPWIHIGLEIFARLVLDITCSCVSAHTINNMGYLDTRS